MLAGAYRWIDRNLRALRRELRLSYLPPLMIYAAYGISGLTTIVGTFFVKDYLDLSAAFVAALTFWAGIPWALKMPLGHLVDLIWRWKGWLVVLGAGLTAASLLIMVGLLTDRAAMAAVMPAQAWYILAELLAPVGYIVQDVVADAMTVEAVPRFGPDGRPLPAEDRKRMNVTMQTLGRFALISGLALVAAVNLYVFSDVQHLAAAEKAAIYREVYLMALVIPLVSVSGVVVAVLLKRAEMRRLVAGGMNAPEARKLVTAPEERPAPNWWILGGSLLFVSIAIWTGLGRFQDGQEIVFAASLAIITFLIARLTRELEPDARATLVGTAAVIFAYSAAPTAGEGLTWWMIDALGVDERFLAVMSLTGSVLTLVGMVIFRRFMAQRSVVYVVGALTIVNTLLALPVVSMYYYNLHQWTATLTGGVLDGRSLMLVNVALSSPLVQIAMIPMLAWIANSAPANLKATYFSIMASFSNLSLSAAELGTRYLNEIFVVNRQVRDAATGAVTTPADYSELGEILVVQLVLGIAMPFATIALVRALRLKWA